MRCSAHHGLTGCNKCDSDYESRLSFGPLMSLPWASPRGWLSISSNSWRHLRQGSLGQRDDQVRTKTPCDVVYGQRDARKGQRHAGGVEADLKQSKSFGKVPGLSQDVKVRPLSYTLIGKPLQGLYYFQAKRFTLFPLLKTVAFFLALRKTRTSSRFLCKRSKSNHLIALKLKVDVGDLLPLIRKRNKENPISPSKLANIS